eukprot:15348682-Ditylum_brightwellii.AAC.1
MSMEEELQTQLQKLNKEIAQLTSRCSRIQGQNNPDTKPHALVDDLKVEEEFIELDDKLAQTHIIGPLYGETSKDKTQ